jgi:hypothetical protein
MNRLRNGLMLGLVVGAGATYAGTRPASVNSKVTQAQEQIVRAAQHNAAHPPANNPSEGESVAAWEAPIIAQEARGAQEAQELTPQRIAKLSFNRAFNEATDVGMLVSDVSDRTSIPAQEVLGATLPKSSVTALEGRNIHFIYNSSECNPFIEDDGNTQIGYIPLTVSDAPTPEITHITYINPGETSHGTLPFEPEK